MKYLSFDQMVEDLMLYRMDTRTKQLLAQCTEEDIDELHRSLGRILRHQYNLWDGSNPETMLNYKPVMVNGVDMNPKHPEAVSKRILLTAWEFMK